MRTLIAAGLLLLAGSLYLVAQNRPRIGDDEGRILALETAWNRAEQT